MRWEYCEPKSRTRIVSNVLCGSSFVAMVVSLGQVTLEVPEPQIFKLASVARTKMLPSISRAMRKMNVGAVYRKINFLSIKVLSRGRALAIEWSTVRTEWQAELSVPSDAGIKIYKIAVDILSCMRTRYSRGLHAPWTPANDDLNRRHFRCLFPALWAKDQLFHLHNELYDP